jgi:hypothetical protein
VKIGDLDGDWQHKAKLDAAKLIGAVESWELFLQAFQFG